jgi:hypothetical protein
MATTNNFSVRLVSILSLQQAQNASELMSVTFDVSPKISESGRVSYIPVTPIHLPGSIQVYKQTESRHFHIDAQLVSRTVTEATANMKKLQLLRSWRYPFFGQSSTLTASQTQVRQNIAASGGLQFSNTVKLTPEQQLAIAQAQGVQLLGAPPEVLYLYGYSSMGNNDRSQTQGVNINRIPTVLTSLSIRYPDDVDYLPTFDAAGGTSQNAEPFPIIMDVSIELVETHSPVGYEQFNISKFKTGSLQEF